MCACACVCVCVWEEGNRIERKMSLSKLSDELPIIKFSGDALSMYKTRGILK